MGLFFIYSLKVAACLIVFYLFYKLLLSKETFHAFNRVALLVVIALSVLIPWLKVTNAEPTTLSQGFVSLETMIVSAEVVDEVTPAKPTVIQVLFVIYVLGVVVFLLREVVSVIRLMLLMRKGVCTTSSYLTSNVKLMVMKDDVAPFSWFRYIVISEKDWWENPREILTHELAHIRRGHSFDVALCNVLIIFQWWNPAAWLLKRELQNVHEFEADEAVIHRGVDAKQYQMLLIRKSVGERLFSMANNLNHHSLKKRITMMTTKKSSPWQKAKALVVLPMAALAVAAFANTEVERMAEQVVTESESVVEKAQADMVGVAQQTVAVVTDKEKTVTVKGEVVDEESGVPIVGVTVSVRGAKISTVTDSQGRFQIENVPMGAWVVVADHERDDQGRKRAWKRQVTEDNASNMHIGIDYGIVHYDVHLDYDKPLAVGTWTPASPTESAEDAFNVVEEMPSFPGGAAAMMKWISNNVKYPKDAQDAKTEGRVIAQFVVEKDGSFSDVHIVKSVSPSIDAEAIRVLNAMPKWNPGKQNGQSVRVKYTVPIAFQLKSEHGAQHVVTGNAGTSNNSHVHASHDVIPAMDVKDMLLLVDGKEVPISDIDKYDLSNKIQSMTVIRFNADNKDISQLKATYGAAANGKKGVIEITTKK
ncbi:MAG: TonB family protein [Prevotella sp.]|nr:TonB family protein [Prevotella sp.]